MDKEKQIEEMAKDINITAHEYCNGQCIDCEHKPKRIEDCTCVDIAIATGLIAKGYRKAEDVSGAECPICHGTGRIRTTDWLTRGIPKEQLEREKREAIKEAEAELRNNQIEEMERIIQKCDDEAMYASIAHSLYDAGYRKTSDVVREIFADIEEIDNDTVSCQEFYCRIMNLKDKYESENDNV